MEIRRIEEEVKDAYLDYAMSVIVGRALPDVRDGLKPVQRRILYAMKDMGLTHNKPFKKCARIVGEVLGKYHPHGDAPVYDALVRMAQPFVMRYPLIQPQGNFGSIDGDPPAAMRYTEARLSPIAEEMLEDLDKECVPFQPNFDGSLKEPLFLPSKFPNLLCNGSSGIAVGMSTNIPPHNLTEVVDGLLALMNGRDPMEHIQGPDFPTGGIVIGDIKQIYSEGRGLLRIRARAKFEKNKIIIYEIPYHVNKASLVREIAQLIKNKRLNASEVRDRSDREGIRIEVIPKRGFEPNRLFNAICKKTSAEITYRVNLLVLSDGQPIHMSFTQMLEAFLEHRRETVRKRTEYLLKQYLKRTEILEGFIEVTRRTDEIIAMIKSSENKAAARERLISAGFTERQAEAILEMKLSSLTKLESNRMQEELRDLRQKIERCRAILNSKEELDAVIKEELLYLKEKYGDERRSLIAGHVDEIKERTVLVLGEYFIEATLPEVQAMRKIRALITTPEALIFGKRRLWRMDIAVLHGKRPSDFEDFLKVLPYFPEGVLLFEDGRVKKMSFNIAKRSTGIKLPSELADAALVSSEYLLISKTDHGYVLTDEELRAMGRASQGVMGIRDGGKYILPKAPWVILFGEGRVLKLPWSEFPKLKRPAKGVKMAPFAIKRAFSAGDESTIYVLEPTPKRIKVKDIPAANHRTNRGEKVRWRDIVII